MRRWISGIAIATGLAVASGAGADSPTLLVTLDANQTGAKIDRHIFGQFAEHLGHGIYDGIWVGPKSPIPNTRGIRNDVVTALKALQVPDVRWPGGCFADEYHWRKGVGPAAGRPVTLNSNWGGVVEPNTFGTHEFLDFVEQIGSEAYLSVNVGSGTRQEMAEWLEYLTTDKPTTLAKERAANGHPAPYKVEMLGIGNEPWGCGGMMTPEKYVDEMKQWLHFAKNYNPAQQGAQHMTRVAAGPSDGDTNWTDKVMKAWTGNTHTLGIEGLSLHAYSGFDKWPPAAPAEGFDEAGYAHVLKTTLKMEDYVAKHSAVMDKYDPQKLVGLVVDEWGAWYAATPGSNPGFLEQQNSQRDAILAALNLNIFARHADRVRGANIAQMINVLQAQILTDGPKMVLTPTYHVFKMYVPFHDATLVPLKYDAGLYAVKDDSLPRLDAVAAKDKAGKLWLALTNVDATQGLNVDLALYNIEATSATGETLSAPKIDAVNTFDHPNAVVPKVFSVKAVNGKLILTLPPESVTVVQLN